MHYALQGLGAPAIHTAVLKRFRNAYVTPAALFNAGTQGAWYDPSDFSSMFQDSAGSTPVTAVEQPVGRINDKSGRGNNATQGTAAARPTLRARYNLLTYSEDLTNAFWSLGFNSFGTRTNGTLSISNAEGYVYHTAVMVETYPIATYTLRAEITCDQNISNVPIRWNWGSDAVTVLVTMTAGVTQTISLNLTTTVVNTATNIYFGIDARDAVVPGGSNSTGYNLTFNKIDLRITNDGVNLPAYQRVAAATDYDTTGFPPYLAFDGTDDSLATSAIDFSATDEMTVVAGIRKLRDSVASASIVGAGADINATDGSFLLTMSQGTQPGYEIYSRGTVTRVASIAVGYPAPRHDIVTQLSDISAPSLLLRLNGTQVAQTAAIQGTGNYGSHALFMGVGGGGNLFNGRIYSLIVLGRTAQAGEITNTEAWVNTKTRAY